jgi:methionyl-tRNA synthetase
MWRDYYPFALPIGIGLALLLLIIWSLIWKSIALWKAARNNHLGWFVAMIILNTVGILEIIYILGFSKKPSVDSPQPPITP